MGTDIRALLREELGLYRALKQAAGEQLERIEAGDASGFVEAADRRDRIQESISRLDARIGSALRSFPRAAGAGETRAFRESMRTVVGEIQALDRRASELAARKRDEASGSLERLRRGRKGVWGYGGSPAPRTPRFIDQKG